MASRSKKKKKNKATWRERLAQRMAAVPWPRPGQAIQVATWLIGLAAIVAGWTFVVPRLQARAIRPVSPSEIEVYFLETPVWMNGDLSAWLTLTVQQSLSTDPMEGHALAQARTALLGTGCFDEVRQVRRVSTNTIEIDASFLQPFAVVHDRDVEYLIDPHGKLLPSGYRVGAGSHFIHITGARFDRPARPGHHWDGADITAALHLIRLIDDHVWWTQIQSIDVADFDRITLLTMRNCRIIWGATAGEEAIGEVTADQKLNRLDYINTTFGRIDIDCPSELDITDPKVVTAR